MTTTIEDGFGARLMTKGGFLLNNELTDFSFAPDEDGKPVANRVEAGKRPRSSMAPTIVFDAAGQALRRRRLARRQPDHQLRREDARRHPRLEARPAGRRRPAELRQPQRPDRARGRHRGRSLEGGPRGQGPRGAGSSSMNSGIQAIVVTPDGFAGGADSRREGVAIGN